MILLALEAARLHLARMQGGAPAAADAFSWLVEHAIAAWEAQGRAFHHRRVIHARTVSCRGRAPGALVFELGLRPAGPPLLRARSGDVLLAGHGLPRVAPAAS